LALAEAFADEVVVVVEGVEGVELVPLVGVVGVAEDSLVVGVDV
jgi:hypothetical protein